MNIALKTVVLLDKAFKRFKKDARDTSIDYYYSPEYKLKCAEYNLKMRLQSIAYEKEDAKNAIAKMAEYKKKLLAAKTPAEIKTLEYVIEHSQSRLNRAKHDIAWMEKTVPSFERDLVEAKKAVAAAKKAPAKTAPVKAPAKTAAVKTAPVKAPAKAPVKTTPIANKRRK